MRSRSTGPARRGGFRGGAATVLMVLVGGCAPDAGTEADGPSAPGDAGVGDAVFEVRRDPG